jgi:hypothetical protein
MKKNRLFMMGTLAVMLAFGLLAASCTFSATDDNAGSNNGDGPTKGAAVPTALVGEWYADAALQNWEFTIKADGTFTLAANDVKYTAELYSPVVFCKNPDENVAYTLANWQLADNGKTLTVEFSGAPVVRYKR